MNFNLWVINVNILHFSHNCISENNDACDVDEEN